MLRRDPFLRVPGMGGGGSLPSGHTGKSAGAVCFRRFSKWNSFPERYVRCSSIGSAACGWPRTAPYLDRREEKSGRHSRIFICLFGGTIL